MSPLKFQDSEVAKGVINGPRPLPLRINKDSHAIQKPLNENSKNTAPARRQPVIIYTHSPKVIHAQPCDFMALVQKLTGKSRADTEKTVKSEKEDDSASDHEKNNNVGYLENETVTSVMADGRFDQVKHDYDYDSSMYAQFLDPNSNELYCSSGPNRLFLSPNTIPSYSPPFMDLTTAYSDF